MAAIITTHPKFNDVISPVGNDLVCVHRTFTASTLGQDAGDILKVCKLPRGVKVVDAYFASNGNDSSTGLDADLEITDGSTVKVLIAGITTVARAGGLSRVAVAPSTATGLGFVTTNGNWYVRVSLDAAATTQVPADVTVCVTYSPHREGAITE